MPRIKRAGARSHPLRLEILRLLAEGPLTQSDLARALNLPWGQLQWHLYVLEREGYVRSHRERRRRYYRLARTPAEAAT